MPNRCQFAVANGLPISQSSVLESTIEAISSGKDPVQSLKACEPLVSKLLQMQSNSLQLRPKFESRFESLMKLQKWMAENVPESQAGLSWQFSKNGNSICALQHLEPGAIFISIPRSLMIQARHAVIQTDSFFAKIPSVALTLQLLIELRAPSSLPNALYVASLPSLERSELDSAWLWNYTEIQELLEGTSAFTKAIRTRLSTIQHYLYIIGRLQLPKVLAGLSLQEWLWASAIILSRQNQLNDGTPVLIPCWDMCNDSQAGAESYFVEDEDSLVAECKQVIHPGDEIFINYGQRTSAQLLVLQGFLHENHIMSINVQANLADLGALPDDIERLRNMLFHKRSLNELPMAVYSDGKSSSALQWAARIACLDREGAALLLRNPEADLISAANERNSRASIKAFIVLLQQNALKAQQRIQTLKSLSIPHRLALAKSLLAIELEVIKNFMKANEATD